MQKITNNYEQNLDRLYQADNQPVSDAVQTWIANTNTKTPGFKTKTIVY